MLHVPFSYFFKRLFGGGKEIAVMDCSSRMMIEASSIKLWDRKSFPSDTSSFFPMKSFFPHPHVSWLLTAFLALLTLLKRHVDWLQIIRDRRFLGQYRIWGGRINSREIWLRTRILVKCLSAFHWEINLELLHFVSQLLREVEKRIHSWNYTLIQRASPCSFVSNALESSHILFVSLQDPMEGSIEYWKSI